MYVSILDYLGIFGIEFEVFEGFAMTEHVILLL